LCNEQRLIGDDRKGLDARIALRHLCEHRLAAHEALEIVVEVLRRGVPALRLLGHRLHDDRLEIARHPGLDLVFLESGGDNLAASFSPELVDASIYVIDVSGGDKIPRKGGPGVTRSDLLVINKIDLAPFVGANLDVMARDARLMRGDRPFVFTNIKAGDGVPEVIAWIQRELLFESSGH
jgi:hypothetical protein